MRINSNGPVVDGDKLDVVAKLSRCVHDAGGRATGSTEQVSDFKVQAVLPSESWPPPRRRPLHLIGSRLHDATTESRGARGRGRSRSCSTGQPRAPFSSGGRLWSWSARFAALRGPGLQRSIRTVRATRRAVTVVGSASSAAAVGARSRSSTGAARTTGSASVNRGAIRPRPATAAAGAAPPGQSVSPRQAGRPRLAPRPHMRLERRHHTRKARVSI